MKAHFFLYGTIITQFPLEEEPFQALPHLFRASEISTIKTSKNKQYL